MSAVCPFSTGTVLGVPADSRESCRRGHGSAYLPGPVSTACPAHTPAPGPLFQPPPASRLPAPALVVPAVTALLFSIVLATHSYFFFACLVSGMSASWGGCFVLCVSGFQPHTWPSAGEGEAASGVLHVFLRLPLRPSRGEGLCVVALMPRTLHVCPQMDQVLPLDVWL